MAKKEKLLKKQQIRQKQDYKFIDSDLQGIVAQINTFYDECEKEEQRDQLNELKAIAESYRERAKALQELYQKPNTEQEIEK